ncbi:hypothetical protein Ahy_B06g085660 [Arachis hypogaea]|uniref:Uncharacterized protein n=1 Tax=Arachis hypogaea TaxID=3818 RepID=A0A444YV74_ARAHY|nr:hypothetical protein Ahy_B06g085660 [Arachis hypogaea]
MKHDGVIDLTEDSSLKPHQLYKTRNTHISNNAGSLEDFVNEIMKQIQDYLVSFFQEQGIENCVVIHLKE